MTTQQRMWLSVGVHVLPRELSPSKTAMTNLLHAKAKEAATHAYWERGDDRGVVLEAAAPSNPKMPTVRFAEDGSVIAFVRMLADVATVSLNGVRDAVVVHPGGEHESMAAEIEGSGGMIMAYISEIHRPRGKLYHVGQPIKVQVLGTTLLDKRLLVTGTCMGLADRSV